jgi:proline iminopeptidase
MTPDAHTIKETFLDVGDGHSLYIHDWGNKEAKTPILFLHGGPGSGCNDRHKLRFNPKVHRVIFHDQRGTGKSLPYGSLINNSTQDLVEDIEKVAKHVELNQFVITGGSWGSFLALAYAIKYPKRVRALIIQGIFTGSKEEIDYLDQGRFKTFFPDVWQEFLNHTPTEYQKDPSSYHFKNILGKDSASAKSSAYIYNNLEGALMSLDDRFTPDNIEDFDPTSTTIEVYYLANKCFVPEGYIIKNAHRLKMPIWLVQGRYDMVCPPFGAYSLHQRLPNSQLIWTTAGHGNDRPNYDVMRTLLAQWS